MSEIAKFPRYRPFCFFRKYMPHLSLRDFGEYRNEPLGTDKVWIQDLEGSPSYYRIQNPSSVCGNETTSLKT